MHIWVPNHRRNGKPVLGYWREIANRHDVHLSDEPNHPSPHVVHASSLSPEAHAHDIERLVEELRMAGRNAAADRLEKALHGDGDVQRVLHSLGLGP